MATAQATAKAARAPSLHGAAALDVDKDFAITNL